MLVECPNCDNEIEVNDSVFEHFSYRAITCSQCNAPLTVHESGEVAVEDDDDVYYDDDEDEEDGDDKDEDE